MSTVFFLADISLRVTYSSFCIQALAQQGSFDEQRYNTGNKRYISCFNNLRLIFLLQRYRPKDRNESLEVQIATVFSKVAPSMLLSSCAEALAFFLGAMTPMPAVRTFSLYAGMAVTFDFLFQITCFVGLLTLDAKRQKVRDNFNLRTFTTKCLFTLSDFND